MPSLPPKSALVVAGRGLAGLDDEAFKMVINGVVDEKVGAIVGELIADAAEQRAVITALAKAEPANLTQARIMINDMKAAGFQRTETEDLFGGMEIAESLFKERARILDNSLKRLRQDKTTFKTLQRQAGAITQEGNILNEAANVARITQDEQTITELTRLANTVGPISDALNEQARALKGGANLQASTENFLQQVRRQAAGEPGPRPGARDVGPAEQAVRPKIEPPAELPHRVEVVEVDGQQVAKVRIDRDQIDVDADNFGFPELPRVLDDADPLLQDTQQKFKNPQTGKYKAHRARLHNKMINEAVNQGKVSARPVAYLMGGGGASGKGTILKTLQDQGEIPKTGLVHVDPDEIKKLIPEYKKIQDAGDSRAALVVHEESSDVATAIIDKASNEKRSIVIDKVMGNEAKGLKQIEDLKAKGYEVQVIGVTIEPEEALTRARERYFSSGRLPSGPALMRAHKGFNSAYPAYAKAADKAILFDNTTTPTPIARSLTGQEEILSDLLYNRVGGRGNLDEQAKTVRQIQESTGAPRLQDRPGEIPETARARPGERDTGAQRQAAGIDSERRLTTESSPEPPAPGEPFLVMRLGSTGELTNRNAGNAQGVARHIMRQQDIEAPGVAEPGNVVSIFRVTADEFGEAVRFNKGRPSKTTRQVGRSFDNGEITYSFPETARARFQAEKVGEITLDDAHARIREQYQGEGYENFDDLGSLAGGRLLDEMAGEAMETAQTQAARARPEPVLDLFGEDTRAAQAIHDARMAIERELNPDDVVPVEAGPGDLFSGKSRQVDLEDEVDRIIYERDLDVPEGVLVDEDGNLSAQARSVREVYDEIDETAKALDELEGCHSGKAA